MKLTTLLTTVFLTVTMTISAQQRYVGDISLLPTYEANWQRFIKLLKQAGNGYLNSKRLMKPVMAKTVRTFSLIPLM
jgi:hypothetical protein